MNSKERSRIAILYTLSNVVPLPASGSRSQTIAGMANYAEDMRVFRPLYANMLTAWLEESSGIESDDLTWGTFEANHAKLQAWIEKRVSEQWQ